MHLNASWQLRGTNNNKSGLVLGGGRKNQTPNQHFCVFKWKWHHALTATLTCLYFTSHRNVGQSVFSLKKKKAFFLGGGGRCLICFFCLRCPKKTNKKRKPGTLASKWLLELLEQFILTARDPRSRVLSLPQHFTRPAEPRSVAPRTGTSPTHNSSVVNQ